MWGKVRTIFLVTLVTLLIWVWADAETQKDDLLHPADGTPTLVDEVQMTVETLPVLVAMPATGGSGAKREWSQVHPLQAELKNVRIAGPRAAIERVQGGDGTIQLFAVLVLEGQDWQSASVSKGAELSPGGLGLRFVGPAPMVRVTIDR